MQLKIYVNNITVNLTTSYTLYKHSVNYSFELDIKGDQKYILLYLASVQKLVFYIVTYILFQ